MWLNDFKYEHVWNYIFTIFVSFKFVCVKRGELFKILKKKVGMFLN